jgi:four helix bundle protein
MKDHKELDVWKKSMDLVQTVYELTGAFPKEEVYGLTSQLRRSAVSIPSNIAEGAARNTDKEFLNFLHIAQGSAAETETQLLIAQRLTYPGNFEAVLTGLRTVQKLLHGLIRHYKMKGTKNVA